MVKFSIEQAKEWLEEISPEDYVAIIHDGDTDGFTSGLIYYHWCKQKGAKLKHFVYTRGSDKIKEMDISDVNKIIITDVGPNMIVGDLHHIKNLEVLYVDHHEGIEGIPEEIKEYRTPKGKYYPCARVAYELTNLGDWLGLAGTLGDAGDLYPENEELLKKLTDKYSTTCEKFRQEISNKISDAILYFKKEGRLNDLFEEMISFKEPKDIDKISEYSGEVQAEINKFKKEFFEKKEMIGDINFFYFEPTFKIGGVLATILTIKGDVGPAIFVTPKKEGVVGISARDNNHKLNVANVLRKGCEGLKDSNTGGHPFAAGARIRSEDLDKFKENVRNYLDNLRKDNGD